MFRVRQSLEMSNLVDDMLISVREFFSPTPEFAYASVSAEAARVSDLPLSDDIQRRRRRRQRASIASGVSVRSTWF